MTDIIKTGLSRRGFLKTGAAVAGTAIGTSAITGFPYVRSARAQEAMTLRYLGTAVN